MVLGKIYHIIEFSYVILYELMVLGKIYHSVEFNDVVYNEAIEKKVVVVGIGNSAVDVAANCAAAGRYKYIVLCMILFV